MTTINFKVTGGHITSSVNGFGLSELKKVVYKISGDYAWKLEISSQAAFQQSVQRTAYVARLNKFVKGKLINLGYWLVKIGSR